MEREIVGWRCLLATTGGLIIGKTGFFIHLMLLSACSRGVIFLRSVGWDNLIAERKLLLTCFLASDTSRFLSLSSTKFSYSLINYSFEPIVRKLEYFDLKTFYWLHSDYLILFIDDNVV